MSSESINTADSNTVGCITFDELGKLISTLREDDIDSLSLLDSLGLIIGKDETFTDYKERLNCILNDSAELSSNLKDNASFNVYGRTEIKESDRVPGDLFEEARAVVNSKYAVNPILNNIFYAAKGIGTFIGGYAVAFDSGLSVMLLRNAFRNKKNWLFYSAKELIAHELCHAVRSPIKDNALEEFFAYNISSSPLRRYLGNCFRNQYDSFLLLAPIFLLMVVTMLNAFSFASINTPFFWILIFIYPGFLLIRNHFALRTFFQAKAKLENFLNNKEYSCPILFRCAYEEISAIAKMGKNEEFNSFLNKNTRSKLRWKVISSKFIRHI